MKIISIEIQETKECHPYLEMIREVEPLPIKAVFEGADIKDLDVLPPSYKKDIYPSQTFAIDSHYERFYIRDEDKKAFEELVNAFVLRAEIRLLEEIIKYREETSKNAWKFIRELKKIREHKEKSKLT